MMLELQDLSFEIASNMRLDKKKINAEAPC